VRLVLRICDLSLQPSIYMVNRYMYQYCKVIKILEKVSVSAALSPEHTCHASRSHKDDSEDP